MQKLSVSLIIPAYNEEKYIGACLDYVFKNSGGAFFEIIVVDNASRDRTREIAQHFPDVKIAYEERKGLTRARQRGFEEARGDILAYIDADTRMPAGWAETIAKEFERDKNLASLSGPYVYYDIPAWKQFLVDIYWNLFAIPLYFIIGYMVVGGNFAIRKKTLQKMGGFNESIEFYGEDTDIARRAHKFGKVKFKPSFKMHTSARRLAGQGLLRSAFLYAFNFISEVVAKRPITKKYIDIR